MRFFPGAKTEDLMFHLIPNLKKNPDNIIIHIGTNDAPYKNENVLYEELKQIRDLIIGHHPDCKNIFISCPIVSTDNKKANNFLKKYIDILKWEEKNVIFHNNILESHLCRDGLHLKSNGTTMLAGSFISRTRRLWCDVDFNREKLPNGNNITLTSNVEPLIDLSIINHNNYSNVSVGSVLEFYRSKYTKKLIIGLININSIRNKFEIFISMLWEVLDVLMIAETKLDDFFPEQQFHIEGYNIPFRLDSNRHGGELLLYVRNNINAVLLKSYVFPDNWRFLHWDTAEIT